MATLDPTRTYTAVIIGAGSGGLTAAIGLAGFGHDTVLVDGGPVGGDCTNVGCIPSKALLHAAEHGEHDPLRWARARRDSLRDDETHELEQHPRIALVRGWARMTGRRDPHVVVVETETGPVEIRAEHVVVCAGSEPERLTIEGLPAERVVTNEEVFDLEQLPRKAVFVGGGAISLEMATAMRDAGTALAIVELRERLLATEDEAVSATVEAALRARGVDVHTGVSIERFDPDTDTAHLSDGTDIDGVELVMLAIGRRPRLARLDLDAAGVAHTATGIVADGWGRTNVDRIWAIGDVTGNTLTTHGANAVGRRVVRAIALPKLPRVGRAPAIPNAIYSRPAVASVGLSTERLAALSPTGRRRYTIDLSTIDRGHTDAIEHGIVVVDVERFTGKVLRAAIVGPAAPEWIGIFTMAIDHGIGLRKLFGMVHPYPAHAQAIGRITDDFARDTFSALPKELWAMVRGRLANRFRR